MEMHQRCGPWIICGALLATGPALGQGEPVRTDTRSAQAARAARNNYEKARKAFEERKVERTLEALDEALRLWPDYADAHFLRAKVAYYQKNYVEAAQHMARAEKSLAAGAALQANSERTRRTELERLSDRERLRIDELRGALARATSDDQRRQIQVRIDDAERYRSDLQRQIAEPPAAVQAAPGLPPDYDFFGGNILLRLGRREEAAERYRRALAAKPDHADAINNLASLYLDAGKPLLALDVLQQAETKGVKVNEALKQAVLHAVGR